MPKPGTLANLLTSDGHLPVGGAGEDLWIADTAHDLGSEPNMDSPAFWQSNDIWVRHQDDGLVIQSHQNPQPAVTNYVYVRVRNRSCTSAAPAETLRLYWAKASVNLGWPAPWDGSVTTPALMGDAVGAPLATPPISAGGSQILKFEWTPPDPADYASFGGDRAHFCLLARIETESTPPYGMATPETGDLGANIASNNNIVLRNVSIGEGEALTGAVTIGGGDGANRYLLLRDHGSAESPFAAGQVVIDIGPTLFDRWVAEGSEKSESVEWLEGSRFLVLANDAWLGGMPTNAGEVFTIDVTLLPFGQKGGDRAHPRIHELDLTAYSEVYANYYTLDGGQTFQFRTLRFTESD
jgi:hypothetical protein